MNHDSIGGYIARLDADRFVGREVESGRLEAFLHPEAANRVLVIHGEAGIGKSTLLRHAARLAERCGYVVEWFDGVTLHDGVGPLEQSLGRDGRPDAGAPRVVFVDRFEQLGARTG
jgi:MoxR-like ATPase